MVEAMTNLYFNQQLHYTDNLDLSEMDVWCGGGGECDGGIVPYQALNYIKNTGVVNEECYAYDPPCSTSVPEDCYSNPEKKITIDAWKLVYTYSEFDSIKAQLIRNGPLAQWIYGDGLNHEMLLVAFRPDPEVTNGIIWKYKDSYHNYREWAVSSPSIMKQSHSIRQDDGYGVHQLIGDDYQRECRDFDLDGYYNWGTGNRIEGCGEGVPQDSDDSNPRLGPYDDNYYSIPVKPEIEVKHGENKISNGSFYSFYNSELELNGNEILEFDINNIGNAQLNLNGTFPVTLSNYSPADFTLNTTGILTAIPMENGTTKFKITFTLNDPITEYKMVNITIQLEEIDIANFEFTLVFTDCHSPTQIEEIENDKIWDTKDIKFNDVLVKNNCTLTITNDIAFVSDASLYIEQGSTVIIDGGHITSLCNSLWKGVDVWGDITKSQYHQLPELRLDQGKIKIINGGKISFAENAIETVKYNGAIPDLNTSGGIVYINDGSIENCTNGVVFYPYKNFYPTIFYPQDNWSSFSKAVFFNDQTYPQIQIYLDRVDGIKINGSHFENKLAVPPFPLFKTTGIYSFNSGFRVSEITMPDSKDNIKTKFIGFDNGIYALSARFAEYISISSSYFEDNLRGIYLSSIETPVIVDNEFLVRAESSKYSDSEKLIGLYLDNQTSGFTIEENLFYTNIPYGSLQDKESAGITINNSGQQPNELYNNNFNNLTVGIAAGGENRASTGEGLCIKCNDFRYCVSDIYVCPFEYPGGDPQTGPTIGIAEEQGTLNEPNETDPTLAAGNTFSGNNEFSFNKDENCEYILYRHHKHFYGGPKVKPNPFSNIFLEEDFDIYYEKSLACPSNLGGGIDPIQEKSTLVSENIKIAAYSDTLSLEIDGGNTDQLNLDVATSVPSQALQLRQQLLVESPYLSDTVMKSAINKENVLPNAMIRDVLTANPQSAKSKEILQIIEERDVQMPESMMGEIMQGQNIYGAMEVIEQNLAKHKTKYSKAMVKLEKHYMSDTLTKGASMDSLGTLWYNQQNKYSKYKLAFQYLRKSDSAGVFNTLNDIPIEFDLTPAEENTHQRYEDLFDILWQTHSDSIGIDSVQIQSLIDISNNYNSLSSMYAMNILIHEGAVLYDEPVYFPDYLKSAVTFGKTVEPYKEEKILKVFPNPTGNYCIIEYDLSLFEGDANVSVMDLYGKTMFSIKLENSNTQKVIALKDYPAGIYYVTLEMNNAKTETLKLIVTK